MASLGSVLTGELPAAELHAARLDGELHGWASGFLCIDEPDSLETRARLAANRAPAGSILELWSAAWVYGALCVPPTDTWVAIDVNERIRYAPRAGLNVREVHLSESEVLSAGTARLTTALRTATDLARLRTNDPALPAVLSSLFDSGRVTRSELVAALRTPRKLAFRQRALEMLEAGLNPH